MIRKRQIRHVIVPDGIVQAERSIASAPAVARSLQCVDDQCRNAKLLQSRREGQAALTAADDQAIGLLRYAEFGLLVISPVKPAASALYDAARRAGDTCRPALLLVPLQFAQRGEKRPAAPILQPQVTLAAPDRGLETEPGPDGVAWFVHLLDLPFVRLYLAQTLRQHIPDALAAFERDDIPGKGQEIPPVAFIREQRLKPGLVARDERIMEVREPARGLLI